MRAPQAFASHIECLQASTMVELARAYGTCVLPHEQCNMLGRYAPVTIPLGLHSLYADVATSTLA